MVEIAMRDWANPRSPRKARNLWRHRWMRSTIETLWDEWTIPKESGKKQDLEEDILSWRSKELTNTIENQVQDKIHKQL